MFLYPGRVKIKKFTNLGLTYYTSHYHILSSNYTDCSTLYFTVKKVRFFSKDKRADFCTLFTLFFLYQYLKIKGYYVIRNTLFIFVLRNAKQ